MCKRLGPVRVKRSKYPSLLFQLTRRVGRGGELERVGAGACGRGGEGEGW